MIRKKVVFLPYDMDTAIGINNSGLLVFGYSLEDIDLQEGGEFIFNGQDSVLWTNLRDAFGSDIKAMYQTLRSTGAISYDKVEQMFENHQSKWCEAIFNEDAYFKYIEPLTNPESGKQPDASYLPMAQGSKAEQRKWWLYNRFRYMDSKWNAGDALTDYIMMRAYSVAPQVLTPYADIYLTTSWDGELTQVRAHRGQTYTLPCPKDSANDAVVAIYSASQLASVGDLSGLRIKTGNFSMATRLQSLKVGDSDPNYSNTNLTDLQLGNNTLMRVLDVRNCPNLAITVDVSGCSNIEEVYFDGTGIAGVVLPNGGVLNTLHLPDSVTNLTVQNQPNITDFVLDDASNLSTLRLENSGELMDDAKNLVLEMESGSRIRLIGINWGVSTTQELSDLYDLLDTMRGLDENGGNMPKAQISGVINVEYYVGNPATIQPRYPNVTITYDEIETYTVIFKAFDKTTTLYTATNIIYGTTAIYSGETPTRAGNYEFKKWTSNLDNITENKTVYPLFTYLGSTARAIIENSEGDAIITSTKSGKIRDYALGRIKETNIEEIYLENVTTIGAHAFQDTSAKIVDLPNATTISGEGAFQGSNVVTVNLPKVTGPLQGYTFNVCPNLINVNAPLITSVAKNTIRECGSLINISLPSLTTMTNGNAFYGNGKLERAYFPSLDSMNGGGHFTNCRKLIYFEMNGNGSGIGGDFGSCQALVIFIIRNTNKVCPLTSSGAFNSTKYATNGSGGAYVYVPRDLISSYQQATNWSDLYSAHSDMFRALEDYTVDGTTTGEFDESKLV